MAQALWRSAVGTGTGASQSKQSAAAAGAPTPRARILEQTGAALGGNFLQNSCVAPNRCKFASNSKKTN